MTRVSIVITCYNLGEYLEEALSSALSQNYQDFEILLIDDGSTDPATLAVLNHLPVHPRLKVLRTANQGVARARNYGIAAAAGDYILPLDADDRILPGYLSRAVPILDQYPEVGFVGCHYRTFGIREAYYQPANYDLPGLLVENVVPISSLFRRVCWEQIGGYAPSVSIEDWDFWLGILDQGYIGCIIPNILFEYRVRPNSRHAANQHPEVYQAALRQIRDRHQDLFSRYSDSVLELKDLQFAQLLAHSHWLDGERLAWARVARERLAIVDTLSKRHSIMQRRQEWVQRQMLRWNRIMAENTGGTARSRALAAGAKRVLRRKMYQFSQNFTRFGQPNNARAVPLAPLQSMQSVEEVKTVVSQLPENAIALDDFYPINPIPRYGYGRPFPPKILDVLEQGLSEYKQTLELFLPFTHQLLHIDRDPNPSQPTEPAWINGFLPGLDSLTLFGLISTLQPRLFLEIGSGNSTRFAAKAKALNSPQTKIISIDPYPRVEIDRLCDENIREPLESVDINVFEQLSAGDFLFFDGSHRVFQNSDVMVFFIDILPYLKSGVYVHIHDIVWPLDYPPGWEHRYYSEQYILAMILLFGLEHFQIVLPNSYIARCTELTHLFDGIWDAPSLTGIERHGGSFWLRKI